MTPSLTDHRSGYLAQPFRSLQLNGMTASDLPTRGGTSTVFSFFGVSLSAAATTAARAKVRPTEAAMRLQKRVMVFLTVGEQATRRRYQRAAFDATVRRGLSARY